MISHRKDTIPIEKIIITCLMVCQKKCLLKKVKKFYFIIQKSSVRERPLQFELNMCINTHILTKYYQIFFNLYYVNILNNEVQGSAARGLHVALVLIVCDPRVKLIICMINNNPELGQYGLQTLIQIKQRDGSS